jgi:hypothetical protein
MATIHDFGQGGQTPAQTLGAPPLSAWAAAVRDNLVELNGRESVRVTRPNVTPS